MVCTRVFGPRGTQVVKEDASAVSGLEEEYGNSADGALGERVDVALVRRESRLFAEDGFARMGFSPKATTTTRVVIPRVTHTEPPQSGRGKGTSLMSTVCKGSEPRGHARKRLMQAA